MWVPITSHKLKKYVGEEDISIFAWDSKKKKKRRYKVCNFGLKAEIQWSRKRRGEVHWSLKRREKPAGHSSRPVSSSCVFSGRRTNSQKGILTKEERYVRTLTVFLLQTIVAVEEWKYKLYVYISTGNKLFVQRCNIRQYIYSNIIRQYIYSNIKCGCPVTITFTLKNSIK